MLDKSSPLWWLFAAASVAAYLAMMFPGMVNRRQKAFVSCGPIAAFLGALAYCANYDWPVVEMLPLYTALFVALALGMVGHQKAMHAYMADRAENPEKPDDGTATPWILQMAFTLPVALAAAFWYTSQ
ncbi:hypothetical protein [Streptomyces sp. NPDC051546]|uniref:hypothetical protein n=1 Tax=Streptomyces sp. NPDC051546 TaxID=3365655 RepID=UPI0037A0BE21